MCWWKANISTKRVKFVNDFLALTKSYLDAELHVHWYYSY